ncbi:MAG: response regulator transcription factor [Bacteroidales bacterium]|nr:response regulator transcription factor [Bacteroidales bacterium]
MNTSLKVMIVDDEPIIRKAIKYEINSSPHSVECQASDDGQVHSKEVTVTGTYGSGAELFAALDADETLRPDYLLVDMELRGEPTGGIAITKQVAKHYRNIDGDPIKIIIISGRFDHPLESEPNRMQRLCDIGNVLFEALHQGANAFVSKNAAGGFSIENILRAISCLERGEQYYFNYPVMLTLKEGAEYYFGGVPAQCDVEITDEERQLLLLEAAGCTAQEIAFQLSGYNETDKTVQDKQKNLSMKFNIVNKSGARIAKALQYGIIDAKEIKYLKR